MINMRFEIILQHGFNFQNKLTLTFFKKKDDLFTFRCVFVYNNG